MSEAQATVSVITPCYNQGQYLDEAVESVLSQTYRDFEIVVVNDGSTDEETLKIVKNYKKPKTRVIHINNQGVAAARNIGIAEAGGTYILPLDADDKIEPTYLEKAIPLLENDENLGIVYCEAEFFGERQGKFHLPEYCFPEILLGNRIHNSAFFRKSDWEQVGGYNSNMTYGWEDYDFWLSIIERGKTVFRIPESLCFYRQSSTSRSALANQRSLKCYTQLFKNHEQLYSDRIDIIFQHILELREQLQQTQEQLRQTQGQLQQTQGQLQQTQGQLQQAQTTITAMESSKFWQLRERWVRLKRNIGLKRDEGAKR